MLKGIQKSYEIVKEFDSDYEAQLFEEQMIDELKPSCNIEGVSKEYYYDIKPDIDVAKRLLAEEGVSAFMDYALKEDIGPMYKLSKEERMKYLCAGNRNKNVLKVGVGQALFFYLTMMKTEGTEWKK